MTFKKILFHIILLEAVFGNIENYCQKLSDDIMAVSPNRFNNFNIRKHLKKNEHKIKRNADFQIQLPVKIKIMENKSHFLCLAIELNNIDESEVFGITKIDDKSSAIRMIMCQYDKKFVYVLKLIVKLDEFCDEVPNLKNKDSSLIDEDELNYKNLYEQSDEIPEYDGNNVRRITFKNEDSYEQMVIRKGLLNELSLVELYIHEEFSKTGFGLEFYGCQYDKEFYYISQEDLTSPLSSKLFMDAYNNIRLDQKSSYLLELAEMVNKFHDIGFSHNDIRPHNIIMDEKGTPRLVGYKFATPLYGLASQIKDYTYLDPDREKPNAISLPQFDMYSILMTMVAIETPAGTDVWNLNHQTKQLQDKACFEKLKPKSCYDNYLRIIRLYLIPRWGKVQNQSLSNKDLTLSDLIYHGLFLKTPELDLDKLVEQMKLIEELTDQNYIQTERQRSGKNKKELNII